MNAKGSFLCQIGIYLYERVPRGFGAHLSCLFNCGELEALFKCWLDRPSSADKAHTSTVVNVNPLEVEKNHRPRSYVLLFRRWQGFTLLMDEHVPIRSSANVRKYRRERPAQPNNSPPPSHTLWRRHLTPISSTVSGGRRRGGGGGHWHGVQCRAYTNWHPYPVILATVLFLLDISFAYDPRFGEISEHSLRLVTDWPSLCIDW